MSRLRAIATGALTLVLVAALAGCTTVPLVEAGKPEATPTATPNPAAEIIAAAVAELGPYPAPPALIGEAATSALSERSDRYWAKVTELHPSAVRPDVATAAFVTNSQYREAQRDCLKAAGETVPDGLEWESDQTEADDILLDSCQVEFTTEPTEPPSDEYYGYLYDVLTQFSVPCLESLGSSIEPAPSRAKFIKKWPKQNWWPSSNRGAEFYDADMAECQPSIDEYR
jgi:hypothetical protein